MDGSTGTAGSHDAGVDHSAGRWPLPAVVGGGALYAGSGLAPGRRGVLGFLVATRYVGTPVG